MHIRNMKLWVVLASLALVAFLVFVPGPAGAGQATECYCGGATCPVGPPEVLTKIDNLDDPKKQDITIVDAGDAAGNKFLQKVTLGAPPNVVKVNGLKGPQGAIQKILDAYTGTKLNVAILDHGAPGLQEIGNDVISNKAADQGNANKQQFIQALQGKIKRLTFLGCNVAKGNQGQTFLKKLRIGLGADEVKGFTGPVVLFLNPINNLYVENGVKKTVGENDGSLGGVSDIVVGSVNSGAGLFYCIVKTDHDATSNIVVTYLQCNIDIEGGGVAPTTNTPPTWDDTCDELAARVPPECVPGSLNNPSETGADALAGPPPPPPYTNLAPSIGVGAFYPAGSPSECGGTPCTIVTSCFEDVGPIKGTGPNIMARAVILDPKGGVTIQADTDGDTVKDTPVDRVSSGTTDIWYNQSNASCDAFAPKGDPDFGGLPLESIQVSDKGGTNINPNPAPWRPGPKPGATVIDFDGDGCTDEQELQGFPPGKCGDDPQNPSDSFSDASTVDLSGVYDLLVRVIRSDCTNDQCTAEAPGVYFFCRSDIQHEQPSNDITVRVYCYTDGVGFDVNPEAYPGITGDGMAGAPPPGPQDANGSYAYGDVDEKHSELAGTFNKTTNNLEISGCVLDLDGQGSVGNVWVELAVSAHQLPGTADIWIAQPADCAGSPVGDPAFDDAELSLWQANPNKGKGYDQDDDGVPTERELQDDIACGRRDPYNKNDYYDVSIPRDGVIDLPNDILGVILHFAPGGYPPGDENWDRPPVMAGAGLGSTWNRGSPDGVIDLPNDILGVILQFNPGGCPPLS